MKYLFFAVALILGINISAQVRTEKANVFVRVFDLPGEKIGKGQILSISDTSLHLKGEIEPLIIDFKRIGIIKTKHSAGNNVLIGAAIGATVFAIMGAVSSDPGSMITNYSAGQGAAAGALVGAPIGAALGGLTITFKDSKSYIINGDALQWNAFKETITRLKPWLLD